MCLQSFCVEKRLSVAVACCLVALARVPKLMHVHVNLGRRRLAREPGSHPVGNNSHVVSWTHDEVSCFKVA